MILQIAHLNAAIISISQSVRVGFIKSRLRSKVVSHSLHLICGQLVSVYRYRAGISSFFPSLEYEGMNCL